MAIEHMETTIDLDNIKVPETEVEKEPKLDVVVELPDGTAPPSSPPPDGAQSTSTGKDPGEADKPGPKRLPDGWTEDDAKQWATERLRKRIDELTFERHEAMRRANAMQSELDEAARIARQALDENRTLQRVAAFTSTGLKTEATARAEADLASAKVEFRQAYELADPDKMAAAQEKMAAARYHLERAKSMETIQDPPPQQQMPPQRQQSREELVRQAQPTMRMAQWAQKNPWFTKDPEMTSLAFGLHEMLQAEGVALESDEYFSRIDKRMREIFPGHDWPEKAEQQQQQQVRSPGVVAPASRVSGRAPQRVKLTETQVSLAKRLGLTVEQYAAQVLRDREQSNG